MPFNITFSQREGSQETTQSTFIAAATIDIGRGAGCDIRLDDLRVSLYHATIARIDTAYELKDVSRENGTYVNGRRIEAHRLANNDTIYIGPYALSIRTSSPRAPLNIAIEDIEQPRTGPCLEEGVQVGYYARYQLSSGLVTKSRLAVLAVLVVLSITALAFVNTPKGDGGWHLRALLEPGEMSQAHHFIEYACAQCHGATWQQVADTTCKTCHDGPQHQPHQAFTPSCVTCHPEHRRRQAALKGAANQLCTQCHLDLSAQGLAQGAALRVVGQDALAIQSFARGHPEFAVDVQQDHPPTSARVRLDNNPADLAQVSYNHKVHLKPEKYGPEGIEQLTCSACHQVDEDGAYMRPIRYEEHCMRCHPLEFDARFPTQVVPHAAPTVVHAFLVSTFTPYCLQHLLGPSEAATAEEREPFRQRPGQPAVRDEATLSFKQCLDEALQTAEQRLFTKPEYLNQEKRQGCDFCHVLHPPPPGSQLPMVARSAIPQHWLSHSKFAHQVHARVGHACEDCHAQARTSMQREDVLLPRLASCQQCHSPSGNASTACVSCHFYHDRTALAKRFTRYREGPFTPRTMLQSVLPSPAVQPVGH